MAVIKECILILVFAVVATSVQSIKEDDYPEVELPGIVIPSHDFRESITNDDPCCLPNKWQAVLTGQTGFSTGGRGEDREDKRGGRGGGGKIRIFNNIAVFFDKDGGQVAVKGDEGGRFHNESGGIIVKFKDNKAQVYFFSTTRQKCIHKEVQNATYKPQCIPKNSTKQAITLGPATGGLSVDAWSFRAKSPEDRRGMRSFVSGKFLVAPNCLPVAGQDRGIISRRRPHSNEDITAIIFDQDEEDTDVNGPGPSRGGSIRFISDTLYSGVKGSIDDPKVFDPPSYCNATLSATPFESLLYGEEHEVYSETMERFVLF